MRLLGDVDSWRCFDSVPRIALVLNLSFVHWNSFFTTHLIFKECIVFTTKNKMSNLNEIDEGTINVFDVGTENKAAIT